MDWWVQFTIVWLACFLFLAAYDNFDSVFRLLKEIKRLFYICLDKVKHD